MKKIIVAIIILICFLGPAETQEPDHKIYLPLVRIGSDSMSEWIVIVPAGTVNLITEPSFEDGITAWTAAGAVITRQTTQSKFGVASLRLVTANAAANEGAYFSHNPGGAGTFTGSIWVYGTGGTGRIRVRDQTNATETSSAAVTLGAWQRIEVTHTAGGGCADLRLYVETDIQQNITYFADGAQLEEQAEATTYCDGDQEGCEWLGAPHGSTSQRSAQSRAGGLIRDLQDDYYLDIGQFISTGMPPLDLSVDSYAILPGGELNSIKVMSRVFTLTGVIRGTDIANLHANKQALLNVLKPGAVPGDQPVRIRYTGAAVEKQIAAYYESGLETSIAAEMECWERVAVRFLADDPFWYGIGNDSEELDSEDGATFRIVAGRLRSTGQWDVLGPPAVPGIAVYTSVSAVAIGPDGIVYFGGNFTNFNNVAASDYIVSYDPQTETYAALGAGLNGSVIALAFGPDGMLYIGGMFTAAGGDVQADYFCTWDGTVFNNLGDPDAGAAIVSVNAIAVGHNGDIYVGGNFANFAGVPNADNIAMWDLSGGAWTEVDGGAADDVYAITVAPDGDVYIGGAFTNYGDADGDRIVRFDGASVNSLSTGIGNSEVFDIVISNGGIVYIGGSFTLAAGVAVNRVVSWNGTAFAELGTGVTGGPIGVMAIGPDGIVYAGGLFTEAGGIAIADRLARWNGSSWSHLDLDLPGVPLVNGMAAGFSDPVILQNYDLWLGFNTTGAGVFAGDVTVANAGTESAYPKIIVNRTGGTSAILEEVRNETTGKELLFNYALLDGETLTIDLTPTQKSIMSSFFGLRPDAILPNSDFGSFALQPGDNLVTCFVATDATITSSIIFEDTYWSND